MIEKPQLPTPRYAIAGAVGGWTIGNLLLPIPGLNLVSGAVGAVIGGAVGAAFDMGRNNEDEDN